MIFERTLPNAASRNAQNAVRACIALWTGVFILFTLRSLTLGLPYLAEQALARLAMMVFGVALCCILYNLARLDLGLRPAWRRAALGGSATAAGLGYAATNYSLLYVVLSAWPRTQLPLAAITQYFVGTVWI